MTFETFDQSDEETWPDQKIPTYLPTHLPNYLPTFLCTSIREHPKGAIIGICDIWDTDYNTGNWEPGLMTIFVTWQLIVTLDSIRNSCDVSTNILIFCCRRDYGNFCHTFYCCCPIVFHCQCWLSCLLIVCCFVLVAPYVPILSFPAECPKSAASLPNMAHWSHCSSTEIFHHWNTIMMIMVVRMTSVYTIHSDHNLCWI